MSKAVAQLHERATRPNRTDLEVAQEVAEQHRTDVRQDEHGYGDTPTPVYDRVLSGLRPVGQHEAA